MSAARALADCPFRPNRAHRRRPANDADRREPSSAVRRRPSLTLVRGTTTYSHDPAGNVLTLTDARAITVTYTYDAANRMTKATYPDATLNVTYTHDAGTGCTNGVGRLCQVTDQSGTTAYAYDAYGNVTEHQKTELGVAYSTKYTYRAARIVAAPRTTRIAGNLRPPFAGGLRSEKREKRDATLK